MDIVVKSRHASEKEDSHFGDLESTKSVTSKINLAKTRQNSRPELRVVCEASEA